MLAVRPAPAPSGSPELVIPIGQTVALSGGGLVPGSAVQLWAPGDGTRPMELARVVVLADGTFAFDLDVDRGATAAPLPVGRQVLEMVGFDADGNQTVVTMTINVAQGDPAPEIDRRDGGLPALSPGEVAATSGGSPEPVSVAAIPGRAGLAVEGAGWAITVDLGSGGIATEGADGAVVISLERSSVATTSGTGFLPGTEVSVWLFSEPTLMVTVSVDEDGEFSSEFLIDTLALQPGPHTLQVQGVGTDGFIRSVNVGVVVAPESVLFESAGAGTGADGPGTPWRVVSTLLLGLLLAGVFLMALRSRRAAD